MVLMPVLLGALTAALLILALLWATQEPAVPPAARTAPADPYQAEVERFRKQVSDWDGSRGMA